MTFPTMGSQCESIQALMPEYALGQLEPTDADSVLSHARECALCRRELSAYERVVDGLLVSPVPAAPSSQLKSRVMLAAGVAAVTAPSLASRIASWLASALSPSGLLPRLSPAVAAIALLVAVGAGYQSIQLQGDLSRLAAQNQTLRVNLVSNQSAVAEALRPGAAVWQLNGTDVAPRARASLYCTPEGRTGLLTAADLPPLAVGQAYQLWLVRDGQRTSGGLLTVDSTGSGVLTVQAPEPLGVYQTAGMTVEPSTGSSGPTGERVLSGQLYPAGQSY